MTVREWFAGQEVLLTGVTSDIGNAVLEKLLRSCPDIKTISVILRSKNLRSSEDRIKDLLSSRGFERVKQECPGAISRVRIFEGNLVYENLGLDDDQVARLRGLNVVIHAGGPHEELLDFCCNLPALKSAAIATSIFGNRGRITESVLNSKLPGIPLVMIRFPAIGPAAKEPIPGYTSVLKGATVLMIGAGYALGNPDSPAAILPVDIAANTLIASAWDKGTRSHERAATVFSVPALGCTWRTLIENGCRASMQFPFPSFGIRGMTSRPRMHFLVVLLLEWLPSFLCDTFLVAVGGKPRMVKEYQHMRSVLETLEPVLSKSWTSDQRKVRALNDRMTAMDREDFYVRTEIDLESYVLCSSAMATKLCMNKANLTLIRNFKIAAMLGLAAVLYILLFL
ncbi:putative fatty acyl-CoA reductase CG5065 [Neodiprion fabricii]|uniref:putative fatty acyl-CoA reductase CG5065 n=1 Tax=Neodiprion fabricii TaxID=2872261 RepID=UPI001ED8E87E|nr:putative fatty acyl-CoA reductase CG5065 [Neodiprion fabricii]